jgi:hypothetical protein
MSGRAEPTEDEVYAELPDNSNSELERAQHSTILTLRSMLAREQRRRREYAHCVMALATAFAMTMITLLWLAANSDRGIAAHAAVVSAIERLMR